jgi:predicted polyphosphate/ATP-dependent NAD kinase
MAQLPNMRHVIQQIDGMVVLFEIGTEKEIVRFDPSNADLAAKAQRAIHYCPELDEESKTFAHVWSGYFYAHAGL